MKLRCDLHVNGSERKLLIVQGPNEPEEHLSLKLAACLLFWGFSPVIDANAKTPALARYDFLPDALGLDEAGDIVLWVECGSTTMNKLDKLTRRMSRGRIVVLKTAAREAQRLRLDCDAQLNKPERVEIYCWPGSSFREWASAVGESAEIFGESSERSINAVVNEKVFNVDLERY